MGTLLNPSEFKFKKFDKTLKIVLNVPKSHVYQKMKSGEHFDEKQLQRLFNYKFQAILPNHTVIYYDKVIESAKNPLHRNKPDFLLWKNDFSEWYVIEVELQNHPTSHVKQQLDTFYNGDYNDADAIANYVASKIPKLDKVGFKAMIANRPRIMLMADHINCDWREEFKQFDCLYSTLQVYSDEEDNFIYRISGEFPQEYSIYTYCSWDKSISALNIDQKKFLNQIGIQDGNKVRVYYRGEYDEWIYLEGDDKSKDQLIFNGGGFIPLDIFHSPWKLIINNKNQIVIQK